MHLAVTDKQRHELFERAEEVFGEAHAETLMDLLPPVGWADVATKDDVAQMEARLDDKLQRFVSEIRAEFQKDLRQQLVTFLTANAVLLGLFTVLARLVG